MYKILKKILPYTAFILCLLHNTVTEDIEINEQIKEVVEHTATEKDMISLAKQIIIVLHDNDGEITEVFAHNKDQKCPPSSMTKIMTLYITFKELASGNITLDQEFTVSENAWRQEGSRTFLVLGSSISVRDLIRAAIVQSGNDSCVALIEGVYGNVGSGVNFMNQSAQELGMTNTHFMDPTGITNCHEGCSHIGSDCSHHYSTMEDICKLSIAIYKNFNQYYSMFAEREFTHNGIVQYNRNPALQFGADGIKTGYTKSGKYGLSFSFVLPDGRRVFAVFNGSESESIRKELAKIIMNYCLINLVQENLFAKNTTFAKMEIQNGKDNILHVGFEKNLTFSLNREKTRNTNHKTDNVYKAIDINKIADQVICDKNTFCIMKGGIHYNIDVYVDKITAPVKAGEVVGYVIISCSGHANKKVNLTALHDIERANIFAILVTKIVNKFKSWVN